MLIDLCLKYENLEINSSKWKMVNQQNTLQFKNIYTKNMEYLCYESEEKRFNVI